MTQQYNHPTAQPIGAPLQDWKPCEFPPATPMEGQYCRIEALDVDEHAEALFDAYADDHDGSNWTYLPYGPFPDLKSFQKWMRHNCQIKDPLFFAIINKQSSKPEGIASYLRITPYSGVTEVGHVNLSPRLQNTPVATEAMYLMMSRIFDELGYRRFEWKCDSLNAASRHAAERLGFRYEGLFRQATVYKQRNRDTAWFSILDSEWPALKATIENWLSVDNFDASGKQLTSLSHLSAALAAE